MKTVGDLLKDARLYKNLSYSNLEDLTHIKTIFIEAIENAKWESLPEENVIVGFIKSLSHFLDVDERKAVALFRREYLPIVEDKKFKVERDPALDRKFGWGPRMTFLVGVLFIIFIVLAYLGIQYRNFNLPPTLLIGEPTDNQTISLGDFTVLGKTDPDATVLVNDQAVVVGRDGSFSAKILVSQNTDKIVVTAKSRSGKMVSVSRRIEVIK